MDEHPSILVVDDVPGNLNLLIQILKSRRYRVRPAPSGRLALESAAHLVPDLVLLDIHMPEMDGFETCRRLKRNPALRDIPVVFISALAGTEDKVKAFNAGGVDYITKPFQAEEVLARVTTHLSLQQYRRELEQKNDNLQETLARLKNAQNLLVRSEKMAALGVLVAGVAHEINNPVNFIKTSLYGLKRDFKDLSEMIAYFLADGCRSADPDAATRVEEVKSRFDYDTLAREVPELIANMTEGVRRTEEIVTGLRTFSRQEEALREEIDLNGCVASALVILRNRYKNIARINEDYQPLPPIFAKPGAISQVIVNILANAIDALDQHPPSPDAEISVATGVRRHHHRPYAAVTISDTGPGIAPEILGKVFDPFFTTKAVGQGTGLGLYISNNIIREHDGIIEVDSRPSNGTRFCVYLPIRQEVRN